MTCEAYTVQHDPYTGYNWVCTGDYDNESMIGWSDDDFDTISFIGQGSQMWRVCQLAFTKEYVYYNRVGCTRCLTETCSQV